MRRREYLEEECGKKEARKEEMWSGVGDLRKSERSEWCNLENLGLVWSRQASRMKEKIAEVSKDGV